MAPRFFCLLYELIPAILHRLGCLVVLRGGEGIRLPCFELILTMFKFATLRGLPG